MSEINALVGVDFSLIGTKLHAAYEKRENGVASLDKNADDPARKKGLDAVEIKLSMAYLYVKEESGKERIVEYAFQMNILTEGMIPESVAKLVDVSRVAIAVWNTNRKKVIEKMALETIGSYLELPAAK